MSKKISVVLFIDDKAKYLGECLDNILMQTHKDIQLMCLIHQPGSEAENLLKCYSVDERVKLLTFDPNDKSAVYKTILETAGGDYILFLDSSCVLELNALEKMIAKADETDADIVACEFQDIDEKVQSKHLITLPGARGQIPFYPLGLKEIFNLLAPGLSNKLIRLDLIRKNNFPLDKDGRFQMLPLAFLCAVSASRVIQLEDRLMRLKNQVPSNFIKDRASFLNLLNQVEFLYQQLKSRKLENAFKVYATTIRICVGFTFWGMSPAVLKEEISLIKKTLSKDNFDCLFYADRDTMFANKSVTVIIPVHNGQDTLVKCLDSVCNQTLTDIEIICVDDASTDDTLKILKKYEKKDKRILACQQDKQNYSAACNLGMRFAIGEYVHFLNPNDYLEPDAYECLYLYAKLMLLDMCQIMYTSYCGKKELKPWQSPAYFLNTLPENVPFVFNRMYLGDKIINLCHESWGTFFSREFLLRYAFGFSKKEITYRYDLPFFVLCALKAKRIGTVLSPLYHYVDSENLERYTWDADCFLYTLKMLKKMGEKHLFNVYATFFSRAILEDYKLMYELNKEQVTKAIFKFYSSLVFNYHYNLPKICYDWCLDYLKRHPSKKLKFRIYTLRNKVISVFTGIVRSQGIAPYKIRFLHIPIGHKEIQFFPMEKITKIVICGLPVLKIKEEL